MAPRDPLSPAAVARSLEALRPELGRADRERLEALLTLAGDDRRIRLGDALAALYSGQQREAALTAFRQFRARIAGAAKEARLDLTLEADTQTRTPPDQRWCWFAGGDSAMAAAERFAEQESRGVVRVGQTAVLVDTAAELRPDAAPSEGKRAVRYFISYAHLDAPLKDALLNCLTPFLHAAGGYRFEPWQDRDILVGKDWHAEIQAAIAQCDFGLLLVSPQFLASPYITREELKHFIAPDPFAPAAGKLAVPVALRTLRFDGTMDMKGLEQRQVFHDGHGKAFQERSTSKTRHDFASALFGAIVRLLDAHFAAAAVPPSMRRRHDWQRDELKHELEDIHYVPTAGRLGTMNKVDDEAPPGERSDAVRFLLDWAREPLGPPCCALLGSVGIGKTTTCKAFTHALLEARDADPALPLPIYLDLRNLGETAREEPELKAILGTVLRRSWQGGQTEPLMEPAEVIRLVQQEGAIAIFDGLDEVLVHLSQRGGQTFTRELLRILPPALWPSRRREDEPGRPGRVLVTCRTHYFRSLREQQTHLTVEDRDDVRDSDYRVFVLLPFDDDQIRAYLEGSFKDRDVEPILATIHAVHNLPEMASRPYTLSLVARALPQIERWNMEGRRVTGVDLYRHMVLSWLERDSGKHELEIEHKQQIMEHVAAALWRSGSRSWTARQMEDWLAAFLDATPDIARHYLRKDLEVLKKDLRTATFLVGGGRQPFRFGHTSLEEFFLAGYLLRALREGWIDGWEMARPSRETLDFLGQMLLGEIADSEFRATLRRMRDDYRPRVSELAFAYALFAQEHGYPAVPQVGVRLDGADLSQWAIAGPVDGPKLLLRGASFRGARLGNAVFRQVNLDEADFCGADLLRCEFNRGQARQAQFVEANLCGTVFRDFDLKEAVFNGAATYRTQLLRCTLASARGLRLGAPETFQALCQPDGADNTGSIRKLRLAKLNGHNGAVNGCAFARDGKRIASASSDSTLRIWDAATGECRLTLEGHSSSVLSCEFAPDGTRVVSGSSDNTIRVWDASNGKCLLILRGHSDAVRCCTFAPDGDHILSASDDTTLRIWSLGSAESAVALQAHSGSVLVCAFAQDGTRIASASEDNTLLIWNAESREPLLELRGHAGFVLGCAFAPDGTRIASASNDHTLVIWDTASGEYLLALRGHSGPVRGCAFSPDGKSIASVSDDNTLRFWNAESGECLRILQGHTGSVRCCTFSLNGTKIVTASADATLRLWDAGSGECRFSLQGGRLSMGECAFAPDGLRLASTSSDNALRIWDAKTGECLLTLLGHSGHMNSCAFSPDGRRLASASWDSTVRIWDVASGECCHRLLGHSSIVACCAFSPDGRRLGSASLDGSVRTWDMASGKCLLVLRDHSSPVSSCDFSPDSKLLLSGSGDGTLRLWDSNSGECLHILRAHSDAIMTCAFSPNGYRIASGSWDSTVRIWGVASGNRLLTLTGHDGAVNGCAFAPDGKLIASASDDRTLRLWNTASGKCQLILKGHTGPVWGCAFAPDGHRIASVSNDGTLRIWDVETGAEIGFRIHLLGDGEFAVLAPDGSRAIQVSREAWRDLGWLVPDATGALTRYPAETFGPLPEYPG